MALSLFDTIQSGADWLEHPDLQELLRRQGLGDVRVQVVGARRTFAGKAWPARGFVRMVSGSMHPVRWLLTLIHELAHIKDFRQRVQDLEQELGRPLEQGRREGRRVWQMDRAHGRRWCDEFVKLAGAAVQAGLFPGNEERVMACARAGATSLEDVELDLSADRRVVAEALRRLDEQHRLELARAQQQSADFKRVFKAGETVHFEAGPHQGVVTGTLVRINQKSSTVASNGASWHVPHGLLQLGPAPGRARQARPRPSSRDRFAAGDEVQFDHRDTRYMGKIVRVNRKTCTVETSAGRWRVAFSLLKPLRKP